jgi:hypothetical protein
MAGFMFDTAWPHSEEAFALCRALDDPMGWAYPPLLWGWGIDTDKRDGKAALDAQRLAQICRWKGDPETLFAAFVSCEVIIPVRGKEGVFYIRGWKRNRRFFKEKQRLRKVAEERRKARDSARKIARVPHADGTLKARGNPSPSPSPYQKEGERARGRAASTAKVDTTRDALAGDVTTQEAAELYGHYQAEMQRVHDAAPVLMPPTTLVDHARLVLVNAERDMALAKRAVTALVESEHKFWVDRNRSLWLLHDPRDFAQALTAAGASSGRKRTRAEQIADEDRRRKERFAREEQEARAEWEREHTKGGGDGRAA